MQHVSYCHERSLNIIVLNSRPRPLCWDDLPCPRGFTQVHPSTPELACNDVLGRILDINNPTPHKILQDLSYSRFSTIIPALHLNAAQSSATGLLVGLAIPLIFCKRTVGLSWIIGFCQLRESIFGRPFSSYVFVWSPTPSHIRLIQLSLESPRVYCPCRLASEICYRESSKRCPLLSKAIYLHLDTAEEYTNVTDLTFSGRESNTPSFHVMKGKISV